MIEVIQHGNKIAEAKCSRCNCVFTYNEVTDIYNRWNNRILTKFIECPECSNEIIISTV